jgi:hypothetical protein
MWSGSRRDFLKTSAALAAAAGFSLRANSGSSHAPAAPRPEGVQVLFPRRRIPLSFIIDDSTCLVNMGHYCLPQFATAWPDREAYHKPWKTWPREIPDAFVRKFGGWCAEHGVKGKYSVVPNPACVGWLDRELPGWSRRELQDSLKLVRELLLPHWDIHPEMITHTRVIDLRTGRPLEEISAATMENSYPQTKKSVDEMAEYLAYALRILKNCDLPCEGITTPGGFGNMVKSELSLAVQQSVRDVYQVEIPHYFKYVIDGDGSTEPTLEHVLDADSDSPRLTVNIPAGTGDWFGSWDGDSASQGARYANDEATSGRMVELIESGRPALMLCHWPGMYCHGTEEGWKHFQRVVLALNGRFADRTQWMKLSEIARYWAAKELTRIDWRDEHLQLRAPFAAPQFTLRVPARNNAPPRLTRGRETRPLREVAQPAALEAGTCLRDQQHWIACFDLEKGDSLLA